jgi:hypothetical protein
MRYLASCGCLLLLAAAYVNNASTYVPGPSADFAFDAPPTVEFQMFPTVYPIPFHYRNPDSEPRAAED